MTPRAGADSPSLLDALQLPTLPLAAFASLDRAIAAPEPTPSSLCGYSASANPAATSSACGSRVSSRCAGIGSCGTALAVTPGVAAGADLHGTPAHTPSGAARREPLDVVPAQGHGGLLTQAPSALRDLRLYVLRSAAVEHISGPLRVFAAACGIRLHIDYCPFGQFYQWALQLGTKGPHFDALLVLVEQEALAPVGTDGPLERAKVAEAALTELLSVVRERVAAPVLVANFASCPVPVPGPVPGPSPGTAPGSGPVPGAGRDALADVLNSRLERLAQAAGVQVVDRSRVALELGGAWADERMRQMASLAFSHQGAIALARELTGHLVALTGLTKKCLVLDLDGTLWGGVLGEDGPEGIALGPGSVGGEAFAAFQWAVLELQARGVIVAVCSKNNEPEALGCMESHPHMALRPAHLAAWRINWETKAANLRAIAADLNIGVDSMVFLDDNPAEIELMRQQLPEVTSLRVPEDPALLPGFLRGLPLFRSLSSTTEDALRARDYVAQRQRAELQAETPSLDRYYASLDMSATVWAMREADVPRVAQVFARTNQFNLTGVRYSESEAQAMLQAGGARCYCLSLTDRFGESGLVGAAALRFTEDGEALIENLVLSCRVMGRTVERSFVAYLAEQARAMGSTKLVGRFVPTQRNQPAEGLYSGLGFTERARTAPGGESAGVEVRAGVDTGAGVAGGAGVASGAGVVTWEADLRVEPLLPSPFVPLVR